MKNVKHKVECLDQVMFIAENGSDQQIRCYIEFDSIFDKSALEKAILYCVKLENVLLQKLEASYFKTSWGKTDESCLKSIFYFKEVTLNVEEEIDSFLVQKIDTQNGPQVKVGLFRLDEKDYLVFIVHHIVADGKGLLNFIKKVAEIYNQLNKNPKYIPKEYTIFDRSIKPLVNKYKFYKRLKIMLTSFSTPVKGVFHAFPWAQVDETKKKYTITHRISNEKLKDINNYCLKYKCSLNDFILTAFYKTFFTIRNVSKGINISNNPIFTTLDFRNYCKTRNENVMLNFSSGTVLQMNVDPNSDFETILAEISSKTKSFKVNFGNYQNQEIPGLNTVLMISLMSKVIPFKVMQKLAVAMQKDVLGIPYYSNAGNIEKYVNVWDGLTAVDAYLMGQIVFHPGFSVDISQYKNGLTLAIGFLGNVKDIEVVQSFYEAFDINLNARDLSII